MTNFNFRSSEFYSFLFNLILIIKEEEEKEIEKSDDTITKTENSTPKTVETIYPNIFDNKDVTTICNDSGSYLTRCGYAGNSGPEYVNKTVYSFNKKSDYYLGSYAYNTQFVKRWPIQKGIINNWHDIEDYWSQLFKYEFENNLSEHPICISDHITNTKENREKLIEIMFEKFNVPAFYIDNQEHFALFAADKVEGIVLNIGHQVTTAVPYPQKYLCRNAIMTSDLGGQQISEWLKRFIIGIGYSFAPLANQLIFNDIKEKMGHVALDYQYEKHNSIDVTYALPDSTIITISDERYQCAEGLFNPKCIDLYCDGVDKLVFDSINACENNQKELYSNIVITGSSTMFEGFAERFEKEIKKRAPSFDINVISHPKREYMTWTGESILANLATFPQMAINLREYKENGKSIVNIKCK